eukprot:2208041-Rhodomonas_salina.4
MSAPLQISGDDRLEATSSRSMFSHSTSSALPSLSAPPSSVAPCHPPPSLHSALLLRLWPSLVPI